MVASHMKNHPPATQEDADKMMRTEEVLASSSNLAVVEKIPQVRRTFSLLALISRANLAVTKASFCRVNLACSCS